MWFKNIRMFQFQKPISFKEEELSQQLAKIAFKPCAKNLPSSYGWVSPLNNENPTLVLSNNNGFLLMRLRIEEKVLPPSVLREQLTLEVKQFEQKSGRKIYKDEKERMKDEVYQTLLSKAFTKSSYVSGYIDTKKQWLIIDCASTKKVSQFISLLNKCIDNIAYSPELNSIPPIMTHWLLHQDYPSFLSLANACLMKGLDENGSVARIKNEDLQSEKVLSFLRDHSLVTQLALEWQNQIRFTLKEDFSVNSIKFLEIVRDLARDGEIETKEERFMSDFFIMTETLQRFLQDLLSVFVIQESTSVINDTQAYRTANKLVTSL